MNPRIGIPRALHFFQHYPFWRTFFEELGAQTIVSPPTNRQIVTAGAQVVADVTCLPVKVYAGHVAWLRDNGNVDFVFTPAIWSLDTESFHCAKFKALPDIVKATVPNCPPLLDIEINPHWRKITAIDSFHRLARRFTWNPFKIERAWDRANEVDARYRATLVNEQLTYPEALIRLYGSELNLKEREAADHSLTIAIVGHPYCLYDDYINHGLLQRLQTLGVNILTSEMVAPEDALQGIAHTTGQTTWFYEKCMSGAAGHYLDSLRVDGLIAVLAFACGPDSTMVETISRRARAMQRPFMSLVLDEHGSATGMVTRLEAFVDMLTRRTRKDQITIQTDRRAPPPVLKGRRQPVVGIPRMGTLFVPIKSLFRGLGVPLEMGSPLSKNTVALGVKYGPEFICTPYKYILGNMIEMIEAGADTVFYVDGADLCRSGNYAQMMRDVLRDNGYKANVSTFSAIFKGGLFALPDFVRQFAPDVTWRDIIRETRVGLSKMNVLDELERRVQYIRPREIDQGSVDKIWEEAIIRVDGATEYDELDPVKQDVMQKLDGVQIDPALRPVKIAITGEYYAILDPFFNLDLEREVGRLGAEVHRTLMMSDWMKATMILEALGFPRRPEIARAAKQYLRWDISGEAWTTVGQTVIHAQKGFDGVIETMPFTCLPEISALNILPRVSRDHNIPIATFIFDEQTGRAGMKTRLEAFVDLLYRRREVRESSQHNAPSKEFPVNEEVCGRCAIASRCWRTIDAKECVLNGVEDIL